MKSNLVQTILISTCYIFFMKLNFNPYKITLYVLLVSVIMQEFLYIHNSEHSRKSLFSLDSIKNDILKVVFAIIIQFLLLCVVYHLTNECFKSFSVFKLFK